MIVHDEWLLTAQRAAVHLPSATAVIADLHIGYEQVRRRSGEAVPAGDLHEVSTRIRQFAELYNVRRLVIAGDLCEDGRHPGPLAEFVGGLAKLGIELAGIVPGNHDRKLGAVAGVPILADGFTLGRWHIIHGDAPARRGWFVQGHVHPCVRWPGVVAPCFLVGPQRLILPAFSADAAGGNVLGRAAWRSYRCGVIVGENVRDFGEVGKLRQRLRGDVAKRKRGP